MGSLAILFSRVRISVIILDENDNEPVFQALPYKASIREDLAIGSILFQGKYFFLSVKQMSREKILYLIFIRIFS